MSSVNTRTSGFTRQAMSISTMPSTPPAALIASFGWKLWSAHSSSDSAGASSNRSAASCTQDASSSRTGMAGSCQGALGSASAIIRHPPP